MQSAVNQAKQDIANIRQQGSCFSRTQRARLGEQILKRLSKESLDVLVGLVQSTDLPNEDRQEAIIAMGHWEHPDVGKFSGHYSRPDLPFAYKACFESVKSSRLRKLLITHIVSASQHSSALQDFALKFLVTLIIRGNPRLTEEAIRAMANYKADAIWQVLRPFVLYPADQEERYKALQLTGLMGIHSKEARDLFISIANDKNEHSQLRELAVGICKQQNIQVVS